LPFATGANEIGGVTLDTDSGAIYLSALKADLQGRYAYLPVVHSFKVATRRFVPSR
jgi:hypothetical protein